MQHLREYLQNRTIGFANAHPDDIVPQTHLVVAAQHSDAAVHEIVHTKGKASTHNFRANGRAHFMVAHGDRQREGEATATFLGLKSYIQYDGPDGDLASKEEAFAEITMKWVLKKHITLLGSLATGEHDDHIAAVRINRLVASRLHQQGYELDLAELQPLQAPHPNSVWVPSTDESIERAFWAAAHNPSQFEISEHPRPNWPIVNGLSFEPGSLQRLRQYPIESPYAAYRYIPAGEIAVAEAAAYA